MLQPHTKTLKVEDMIAAELLAFCQRLSADQTVSGFAQLLLGGVGEPLVEVAGKM